MTEPCGECGTRQEEWYDLDSPLPSGGFRRVDPPPYEAVGIICAGCQERAKTAQSLQFEAGDDMEPGVKIVLRHYDPDRVVDDGD